MIKDNSGNFVLQDYKYASVWEVINNAKPERAQQLNMLAWLARYNSYSVTKIQNVMILRDWSMRMAKNNRDYPQAKVAILDQPIWQDGAIEEFVLERIDAHVKAKEALPLCSDEERWMKPPVYAVIKNGNKRAERNGLHKSHNEAFDWCEAENKKMGDKKGEFQIETRRSEAVRCENYCFVSGFCSQWIDTISTE